MKRIVKPLVRLMVVVSLAGPTSALSYATDVPTTQAECEKAGMEWKPKAGKCKPTPRHTLSPAEKMLAMISIGCAVIGLFYTLSEYRTVSRRKKPTQ